MRRTSVSSCVNDRAAARVDVHLRASCLVALRRLTSHRRLYIDCPIFSAMTITSNFGKLARTQQHRDSFFSISQGLCLTKTSKTICCLSFTRSLQSREKIREDVLNENVTCYRSPARLVEGPSYPFHLSASVCPC